MVALTSSFKYQVSIAIPNAKRCQSIRKIPQTTYAQIRQHKCTSTQTILEKIVSLID